MITNVMVDHDEYYVQKKEYYRERAFVNIIEDHPVLCEEYERMSEYYNTHEVSDDHIATVAYMMEKYNVKFIEEKGLVLDEGDTWKFAVAIKVEWDGIKEEG